MRRRYDGLWPHHEQLPDFATKWRARSARQAVSKAAISILVASTMIMLAADVYVGAAEAGDRDNREQQNRERERSNEEARRNAEREQERARDREREREREAAKRASETQRESSKSEQSKSEAASSEPSRDADKNTSSASARDDRQDRSSNGDDDKKRTDGTAAQSTGKSRVETKKVENEELPRTVEEMFRRWSKSFSSTPETTDVSSGERKDTARKDDDGKVGDSKNAVSKGVESKAVDE